MKTMVGMSINLDKASQDQAAGPDTQVMMFSKPGKPVSETMG